MCQFLLRMFDKIQVIGSFYLSWQHDQLKVRDTSKAIAFPTFISQSAQAQGDWVTR